MGPAAQERRRAVVASGDVAAIKKIYSEYGDELLEAHKDDRSAVPVLSLPETSPVVTGLLRDVTGLVLDAGCGPQPTVSIELTDPSRTIVGLDIALPIVSLARLIASDRGKSITFVVGDLEHLPFRHRVFDAVVCDDTIEHVPNDAGAAAELARVTADDGRVVVATPNRWSAKILLVKVRDSLRRRRQPREQYFVADSHLREYTRPELGALLRPSFTAERWASVGWSGSWRRRAVSVLTALPGLRIFDQMLVVSLRPRRG